MTSKSVLRFINMNLSENNIFIDLTNFSTVSLEFIEKHKDWKWNMGALSRNPSLTMEFIEKHLDKIYWNYLCKNRFICWRIVLV